MFAKRGPLREYNICVLNNGSETILAVLDLFIADFLSCYDGTF